ncbi:uncharacterized protein [Antedon mediterranea]|uniref:uncharacterized protein isoform X2 n=1 Tax=Antedon mediterranea TaxID=105859 RepID=UPI003AF5F46B
MDVKFQTFLSELSEQYVGVKVLWLKMLLCGMLPIGDLDGIDRNSAMDLFNKLTSHGFISKTNVTLLLDIARATNQASAIDCIDKYKNTIQSREPSAGGTRLTEFRGALFKALTNVGEDDLKAVIGFYRLGEFRFNNIWDVVYHIEKEGLLDSKEDYETFAKHLNKVAQSCLKETPYQTPSPIPASSLVLEQELSEDFGPCDELKQPNGFSILEVFFAILRSSSKWYDKRNYTDQLRVLYKDKIPSVSALREANGTMDLFTQLENGGHLSATNTKILVDTINVTGTHGVLRVSKHLQDIYDNTDHRVTSFSSYRQSLMQFGNSLSESDVRKLIALLNGSGNEWTVILDLEESGILNEDELQQFIKLLKENGIRGGANTLERKRRNTNHPTKC